MDIAKLCRICEVNLDDEIVNKRTSAIKSLKTTFGKNKNVNELLQLGSAVSEVFRDKPNLPRETSDVIAAAIIKSNVSYDQNGKELEIAVCGMGAVLEYIESASEPDGAWHIADVLAVAVWSVTDFVPTIDNSKLEELRTEATEIARNRVLETGLSSRERYEIDEIPNKEDLTVLELAKATDSVTDNLKYNSAMDREEIDLLWWVLAGRSELLDVPLSNLNPITRAIISGIEIGSKLRFLPSQSIRNLVIRDLPVSGDLINIETILKDIEAAREAIVENFSKVSADLNAAPNVFPLLNAIATNSIGTLISSPKKSLNDWASRALLESSIVRARDTASREL